MKRLVLVAALAVATVAPSALAASTVGCPEFWYPRPTGLTNPVTGRPITYCWPMS